MSRQLVAHQQAEIEANYEVPSDEIEPSVPVGIDWN